VAVAYQENRITRATAGVFIHKIVQVIIDKMQPI
jgi:hypothetical protein